MLAFNVTNGVAIAVICVCVIALLVCGARAMAFSSKLPRPFLTVCRLILITDIVLMLLTGIQPWSMEYDQYEQEFISPFAALHTLAMMLFSLERTIALKFPLKYLGGSGDHKKTSIIAGSIFAVVMFTYVCARLLICYALQHTFDILICMPYQLYCLLAMETLFIVIFSACFLLVCHTTATSRRQHTRRITRMGLPQNHAISATDTRCSAILFIIYPCGICLAVSSVLLVYWPFIKDKLISTWLSASCRILSCSIHGVLFNFWFDEWRLHLLTLLAPLSAYFRDWSNAMRINVYNIVIAKAIRESRPDGMGGSQRVSRSNTSEHSNVSGTSSSFSLSQKSFACSVLEQAQRAKMSRLEDIQETEV